MEKIRGFPRVGQRVWIYNPSPLDTILTGIVVSVEDTRHYNSDWGALWVYVHVDTDRVSPPKPQPELHNWHWRVFKTEGEAIAAAMEDFSSTLRSLILRNRGLHSAPHIIPTNEGQEVIEGCL